MMKCVRAFGLVLVALLALPQVQAFSDVPADDTNRVVFEHLRDLGIMTPQGQNQFQPSRTVTRVEALAVALRSAGWGISTEWEEMPYADVPELWQQQVVMTAHRGGLITPDFPFAPFEPVTKAVFMDWLVRAHGVSTHRHMSDLHSLSTDISSTSPYAPAFALAKTYHIIHLHPDGSFHAFDTITRGQAAVYTYRLRQVLFSNQTEKEELRMRAAFEHFLSALKGGRTDEAERQAIALRDYAQRLIVSEGAEDAIVADAIARAVDHFVGAMRAFEYNRSSLAWSELMLCSKQLERAQEVPSRLSSFAEEFEQMLTQTMKEMSQG